MYVKTTVDCWMKIQSNLNSQLINTIIYMYTQTGSYTCAVFEETLQYNLNISNIYMYIHKQVIIPVQCLKKITVLIISAFV